MRGKGGGGGGRERASEKQERQTERDRDSREDVAAVNAPGLPSFYWSASGQE